MPFVKSKNGQPERGRSAVEDEIDTLGQIASRLSKIAAKRGFSVGVVIAGHDPLSGENWTTHGYEGNCYAVFGAMHFALKEWEA